MKKFLLILLAIQGLIDAADMSECKVDIYYANGIMMQDTEASSKVKWGGRLSELLIKYPQLFASIGNTDVAYNISKGLANDLYESFLQKVNLEPEYSMGWNGFRNAVDKIPLIGYPISWAAGATEIATQMTHDATLQAQMEKYRSSIESGRGVVVVAHSQGNLFALEAYRKLNTPEDQWMQEYFRTIAVATPADRIPHGKDSVYPAHGVTFYNDFINYVPGAMNNNIPNVNKYDHVYFPRNALNEIIGPRTLERDLKSINYHGFGYYLGYYTYEEMLVSGSTGKDAITNVLKVKTDEAKNLIVGWLYDEIVEHSQRAKCGESGGGGDTGGGDTGDGDTGGDENPADFDFHAQCSDIKFPDPIPDELGETIDGILSSADDLVAGVVCPLIDDAVKAYNLANGGGVPGGP